MVHPMVPLVVPIMAARVATNDGLRQEMRQVVDLMKNLSLNLLSNVENKGCGKSSNQPNGNSGQGNGGRKWKNMPTCYNCGEIGCINLLCNKPTRMGGDMYPFPAQLTNRSNDFGIETRENKARSSKLTSKEKGKTKVPSVVKLEKIEPVEDPVVMPIGKRTTKEKEGRILVGPHKKKGKSHEVKDVKVKRKREPAESFM